MTREEAIKILKDCELNPCVPKDKEAVDMAIKALEQEPCEDCITEDREKGHWVEDIINGKALISCSECLHIVSNYDGHFHYCPYCGRELKGVIRNDKNK